MTRGRTVGPKGQVVIEKAIRDRLGIEPGWLVYQSGFEDHVRIYFFPPEHNDSLAGSLADDVTDENRIGGRDWNKLKEQAWAEAAREKMDRLHEPG